MIYWKPISGYEGFYEISNMGDVKSLRKDIIMKQINRNKYKMINLRDGNGIRRSCQVHRLVAIEFIDNPLNLPEVNHIKGIKTDNRASELEWSTRSGNMLHAYSVVNIKNPGNKLTIQVSLDGFIINEFESRADASRSTGLSDKRIADCVHNRIQSCGNYLWF